MGIFSPIVQPAAGHLAGLVADLSHRRPVGAKTVRHYFLRTAVPFHHFAQKLQRGLAVPLLCDERFKHFAFVINRPPKVIGL